MRRLVLATGNPDKAREIAPFFEPVEVEIVAVGGLVEEWDVEETGATLRDNAVLKARRAVEATGLPAVADDTGLFVDALDGAPGVRSSRYAGEEATYADNVEKLLLALERVGERSARFVTVAALIRPDGEIETFEGVLEGRIVASPRGDRGFGYDPVFLPEAEARTLGEIPLAEKNRFSHRARAFRAMAEWLARHATWLAGEAADPRGSGV